MSDRATFYKRIRDNKIVVYALRHKKHILPVVLLLLFIILVSFRISGTSIGVYNDYFNGVNSHDPSLLYGKPQPIRSDEWLVSTQLTIAQASDGFKAINENFAEPKDLALITDVPSLDWSTIFKPQNISFFIMPLEFAFAFKWWLLIFSLIISAYYFILRITRDRILVSLLSSIIIAFSPFVFWWYQTATIAPLTYGFIIILISMSIIDKNTWFFFGRKISQKLSDTLKALTLAYTLIAFALILYPPFLIPIAIVVASFIIGYLLNNLAKISKKDWVRLIVIFASAVVITVAVGGVFVATRSDAIHSITSTKYPGKRDVSSGGYNLNNLLVTYLQPQLQRGEKGTHYLQNQSESSSFILLPIFFIVPTITLLIWSYRKKKKIDWILVGLLACILLFMAHLFIPAATPLTKLFLLNLVPQSRLLIGLGMVGFIMTIYTGNIINRKFTFNKKTTALVIIYTLIYFVIIVIAGLKVISLYPDFISSKKLIFALATIPTIGFGLVLLGKIKTGAAILVLFSIVSVAQIQPLYIGLGPVYKSALADTVESLSDESSIWGIAEDIYLENIPQMSDRRAITGVSPYPSLSFWKKYSNQEDVYNRYAHTYLSTNNSAPLVLVHPDSFAISLSCDRAIIDVIDYVISPVELGGDCDRLVKTINYPARTLYFYEILQES